MFARYNGKMIQLCPVLFNNKVYKKKQQQYPNTSENDTLKFMKPQSDANFPQDL